VNKASKLHNHVIRREELELTGRMLDDLNMRVDNTGSRLKRATKQLNDFIRKNESESTSLADLGQTMLMSSDEK
jgi:hypothetical protein